MTVTTKPIQEVAVFDPVAFKRTREKSGLTQRKLAEKIGKTPQAISQWEQKEGGTLPDLINLIKTADVLKCSVDELIGRKEAKVIEARGYELLTAWEKLPDDWQERIYYFVTTFGILKRVADGDLSPPPPRYRRNPPKKRH